MENLHASFEVHAKVEFPRFPPDVTTGRVHSTTFDPELRNELKNIPIQGGTIPQLLTLNSEMKVLY